MSVDQRPLGYQFDIEEVFGMERETGIEPATNGLGSRDSTTELLPPVVTPNCRNCITVPVVLAVVKVGKALGQGANHLPIPELPHRRRGTNAEILITWGERICHLGLRL